MSEIRHSFLYNVLSKLVKESDWFLTQPEPVHSVTPNSNRKVVGQGFTTSGQKVISVLPVS